MDRILFYKTRDSYGCFSNFSMHAVLMKGLVWPTSEHYFQAQKFAGTEYEEEIRRAVSPAQAAKMGRDRSKPLRRDWENVKDDVMHEVVLAKFSQHEDLKKVLLDTGDAEIVEHTTNDSYWGDGGGDGRNQLGKTLMRVRERIRSQG